MSSWLVTTSRTLALRRTVGVGVIAAAVVVFSVWRIAGAVQTGDRLAAAGWLAFDAFVLLLTWSEYGAYRHPSRQETWKRLASWGDAERIGSIIERQLSGSQLTFGDASVTPDFVVNRGLFTLSVHRLDDLLWAYRLVTTTRLYAVVPVARRSDIILRFTDGTERLAMTVPDGDRLLHLLAQGAPWAEMGYSKDVDRAFKKNFDAMKASILARRGISHRDSRR